MKSKIRSLILIVFLVFAVNACTLSLLDTDGASPTQTPTLETVVEGDWYTLYFTDPNSPNAESYRGGPDAHLAAAIDAARASVDIAIYDLNLWSIRDALLNAHRRGVAVRMVVESDNLDEPEVFDLGEAGIDILGDRREALMHNKFVVIDQAEVWTGSMNFTVNGAYKNNNNLIQIRSSRLAQNYTVEFEEMFVGDHFGVTSPSDTPHPTLTLDGTRIETYFSPEDGVAERYVGLIGAAEASVYFMAFSFTSDDIALAMLGAYSRGLNVTGVFEQSQYYANIGTEFDHLLDSGLGVRLDGNGRAMHHKVIIIDEKIVMLGSYNFSASAEDRNDENVLIIHNADIAAEFLLEFARVYNEAQP